MDATPEGHGTDYRSVAPPSPRNCPGAQLVGYVETGSKNETFEGHKRENVEPWKKGNIRNMMSTPEDSSFFKVFLTSFFRLSSVSSKSCIEASIGE